MILQRKLQPLEKYHFKILKSPPVKTKSKHRWKTLIEIETKEKQSSPENSSKIIDRFIKATCTFTQNSLEVDSSLWQ